MNRTQAITIALLSSVLCVYATGCSNRFWDPTQIGRFRPTPAVNVILDSLGVAEEAPMPWEKAEEPKLSDTLAVKKDYVFRSGDMVRISIYELFQEGVTVISDYVVTETGKISIPDVGVIQAAGLTETQLEEEIKQILSPSILKEPSVSVILLGSQQRTFSILGEGVSAAGRYVIPRYDFRLADALATAGGVRQFNVSYIYVSRFVKDLVQEPAAQPAVSQRWIPQLEAVTPESRGMETIAPGGPAVRQPDEPEQLQELEREMLEMISPQAAAKRQWPQSDKVVIASTEMGKEAEPSEVVVPKGFTLLSGRAQNRSASEEVLQPTAGLIDWHSSPEQANAAYASTLLTASAAQSAASGQQGGGRIEWVFQNGRWVPIQAGPPRPTEEPVIRARKEEAPAAGIEWVFQDGRWVPVQVGPPAPKKPEIEVKPEGPVIPLEEKIAEQLEWQEKLKTRVIKIPVDKLLGGDPRYNIVIKPGDTIHVPVDIIGEFCIMGNVNRTGYINITGRPMTLKMAVAAAGGLGPLAWPKKCEVIRRLGKDKEEMVMVDLDKIARGEQPDFFIKPNDLINVGTDATSRWRAVLRNAFRATYGFGFVYDRNFAYQDYYGTKFNPITPWEWGSIF